MDLPILCEGLKFLVMPKKVISGRIFLMLIS